VELFAVMDAEEVAISTSYVLVRGRNFVHPQTCLAVCHRNIHTRVTVGQPGVKDVEIDIVTEDKARYRA
jgi:hypothetical protein